LKVSAKAILGNKELKHQMKSKENVKKGKYVHEPTSGDSNKNVI